MEKTDPIPLPFDVPSVSETEGAPREPTPVPFESLKVQVDYAKWLATVCVAVIAASGTMLAGKVEGVWLCGYIFSLCAMVWCVAATGTILVTLAHLIAAYEQGTADESHTASAALLRTRLTWQWKVFSIGLLLFAGAIASTAFPRDSQSLSPMETTPSKVTEPSLTKPKVGRPPGRYPKENRKGSR